MATIIRDVGTIEVTPFRLKACPQRSATTSGRLRAVCRLAL
jgi:hypothetical protein